MQTYQSLVTDTPADFRVSTDAYRGEAIFRTEMERIFYRSWLFLCHESEISAAGDFKSTMLGDRPVIVARGSDGEIRAFINACTHRGATLCREETGNTRTFNCPYHGWSFSTSGELVGIVDRPRYPDDFDMSARNLQKVPQVASYGGLVFGCFDPDVMSLDDYLGPAKRQIDLWVKRAAGMKYRALRPHRYAFDGNWKLQSENVYDGYHAPFVHGSFFRTVQKFAGTFENRSLGVRHEGFTRGFPQGHGSLEAGVPFESAGVPEDVKQGYMARLTELYGASEAAEINLNRQLLIFPNVVLFDFFIRVIQPIAHDRTEVYAYSMDIEGVPTPLNANRLMDTQTRVGSAGVVSADDFDVFAGTQNALRGGGLPEVTLSRGLGRETIGPGGELVGAYTDETPQRAFWRRWAAQMDRQGVYA